MQIEKQAEVKLLADLVKHPNRVFDVTAILRDSDFQHLSTRYIFVSIKKIAEETGSLDKDVESVDKEILKQKIASTFGEVYSRQEQGFNEVIDEVYGLNGLNIKNFKSAVNFVLKNSITKKAEKVLEKTKKELGDQSSYSEVLAHVESSIFDFTSNAIDGSDIVVLGENYEQFLAVREQMAQKGDLHIGISTGFPELDKCIGGGLRDGTINMFAARAKMGKSWFGLKVADNVACQNIPVLYMDTELEENYQSDRRCAQNTQIPIHQLEKASFTSDEVKRKKVENFIRYQTKYPIYYVDIKGWSIDRQISVIRKFFAKHVGKRADGRYNRGLVVLDYLKLMKAGEKGADKEWEALGYRMTLLHDLMGEYNNPMLALAQQNRDGLEKEDESTISGSDRIIWLCDNFSIIGAIPEAELIIQEEEVKQGESTELGHVKIKVPNTKLKVVVCRHGPGTPGGYIAYYCDIRDRKLGHDQICGHIEEGGRRVAIQAGN